ncbi:MAG: hypothetical protein CBC55_02880 [Gammaproteobacteria bacterium TMED95]|nr:MAG: hypothetical protein CBC55_02880 [Gammaproteobacteria bacterium TMED95]|tara:strand:+ start:14651 stop:15196 length:546 start_codon:yes stop_codon:yes gene_type:complete
MLNVLQKRNKNQRGFTMIEIGIAIAIMLIGAAIIVPIVSGYLDTSRVNNEVTAMRATFDKVQQRYQREPITTDIDNQELIEANLLAANYRTNSSFQIYNIFDGQVTIDGVDENGMTWVSAGIPESVCAELVENARSLQFELVTIGSTELRYSDSLNADFTQACIGAVADDVVTITWTLEEN